MDEPLEVGASGRSSLRTFYNFDNFPIAYADLVAFGAGTGFTHGPPGVTIDCRTSGQPQYSNNASTSPDTAGGDVDNNSLPAPNGPGIFIAVKNDTAITNFVRLFPSEINDPNVGVSLRKVVTNEDCDNPGCYRWFLCSPLYT